MKQSIKAFLAVLLSIAVSHAQVVQPINNGKLINTLDGNSQDIKSLDQIGVGNTTVPTARIHLFPGGTPTAASDGIWIGNDVKIYRNAANSLTLDGNLIVTGTVAGAGNVVTLDGNNTWTGTQTFNGAVTVGGNLTLNSGTVTIAGGTATAFKTALALTPGVNIMAYDGDLNTIAGFTPGSDNFIGSVGGVWALRSAAQVRTSLSLGAGDTVSFGPTTLGSLSVTGTSALTGNVTTGGTFAVNGLVLSNSAGTLAIAAPVSTSGNITFTNNASSLNWSDVNLYRAGANQLKTDDDFIAKSITLTGGTGIGVGSGGTGLSSVPLNHILIGAGGGSPMTTTATTVYSQTILAQGTAADFLTAIHANAYNLAGDLTGSTLINPQIAASAVTTTEIADGTIATADIGALQITSALIANGAVTGTQLETLGGLTPGTYGNANGLVIPLITVDAKGRITAASNTNLSANVIQTTTNAGGDLTGSTYASPTIATGAVTSAKILDGTILGGDISGSAALSVASLTLSGAATLNGNVTLGDNSSDAITVNGVTVFVPSATFQGDLIAGDSALVNAPFYVDAATDTVRIGINSSDTLNVNALSNFLSNVAVNTNKFNITAASGNTSIAGTLDVTGDVAVNTNKFTVAAASGNTTVAGTFTATGNITLGASTVTMAAATGNTVIGGTLSAGATTITSLTASAGANITGTVDMVGSGPVIARGGMSGLRPTDKRIYVAPGAHRASDTRTELTGYAINKYDEAYPWATFSAAYAAAAAGDMIVLRKGTYTSINMNATPVDIEIEAGAVVEQLIVAPSSSATINISGDGFIADDTTAAASILTINTASSNVHIRVPVRTNDGTMNTSGLVRVQAGTAWFHSNILNTFSSGGTTGSLLNADASTVVHMLPGSGAITMSSSNTAVTVNASATSFIIHSGATIRGAMSVGDYTKIISGERRPGTGTVTATNSVADALTDATAFTAVFDTEAEDADSISDSTTGIITPKLKEDYVITAGIPIEIVNDATTEVDDHTLTLVLEKDADGGDNSWVAVATLDRVYIPDLNDSETEIVQLNGNYRVKPDTANLTQYRLRVTSTKGAAASVPTTVNLDDGAWLQITPVR